MRAQRLSDVGATRAQTLTPAAGDLFGGTESRKGARPRARIDGELIDSSSAAFICRWTVQRLGGRGEASGVCGERRAWFRAASVTARRADRRLTSCGNLSRVQAAAALTGLLLPKSSGSEKKSKDLRHARGRDLSQGIVHSTKNPAPPTREDPLIADWVTRLLSGTSRNVEKQTMSVAADRCEESCRTGTSSLARGKMQLCRIGILVSRYHVTPSNPVILLMPQAIKRLTI